MINENLKKWYFIYSESILASFLKIEWELNKLIFTSLNLKINFVLIYLSFVTILVETLRPVYTQVCNRYGQHQRQYELYCWLCKLHFNCLNVVSKEKMLGEDDESFRISKEALL
jgi:hypothetical protein